MKKGNIKSFLFYFLMSLILLDFGNQLKKISANYIGHTNPFFSVTQINNTGSAFSLFQNCTDIVIILGFLAIIFIGYYIYRYIPFKEKTSLLVLTLFAGGTLGNSIERITTGHVVDYIRLSFINFPVFNAFDIMICLAIFIYIIFILFEFKGKNADKN